MIYFIGKYLLGPFILLFWRPRVFGGKHLKVKGPAIFIPTIFLWRTLC